MTHTPLPRAIANRITGDRIAFLASPMLGDGKKLVFRCTLPPFAAGAPLHMHDAITESFFIEDGALDINLGGGARRLLQIGDGLVIAPGTQHGFRNPLDRETTFVTTATPGLGLERFLRAIYAVANDGGADATGMPRSPLALAAAMSRLDILMAGTPPTMQRVLIDELGRLATLTGVVSRIERLSLDAQGAA